MKKSIVLLGVLLVVTASLNSQTVSNKLTFTIDTVSFDMIYVNGGEYKMVANMVDSVDRHQKISDFYIGETEVTQELWEVVMQKQPSYFKGHSKHPVEQVSWNDCKSFVEALNLLNIAADGCKFIIPSSAQWEYAARGGHDNIGVYGKSPDYRYSGSNNLDSVAWVGGKYGSSGVNHTHVVGLKVSNALGIYDMTGNVWEWCEDKVNGDRHILRGSSWGCSYSYKNKYKQMYDIDNCNYDTPDRRYYTIGFRIAMVCEQ